MLGAIRTLRTWQAHAEHSASFAKIRFELPRSCAQFGPIILQYPSFRAPFSASAPDFCTIQKWPKLRAERLKGPDQGAGLFIFVSYSIFPRRWTSLLLAALKLIALLSLSRDATCKTPLDNFIARALLQLAA